MGDDSQTTTHRLTKLAGAMVLTITVVVAGLVGSATPAAAADGLDISASYDYRLSEDGVLSVEATYTLRNVSANTRRGNVITSYYYDRFFVPLPDSYRNLTVTDGQRDLTFEIMSEEEDGEEFEAVEARFARRLNYGRTTTLVVGYEIEGSAPRSEWLDRINPAYALFGAWGFADDGQLDISVEVPAGYEVQNAGDHMQRTSGPEGTVFRATAIDSPNEFTAVIVARNDDLLDEVIVDPEGAQLTVRHWPGDVEWRTHAVSAIEDGLPLLEELVGSEWPEEPGFEILQSSEPNEYGYAGWFDPDADEILVDESLDVSLMLHELSHAWFNDDMLEDRWLIEGFAEEYSRQVALDMGADVHDAHAPGSNESRHLNRWTTMPRTDDNEEWGYNTSAWLMEQLTDELGADSLTDLFAALTNATPTWPDETGRGTSPLDRDWRRVFDVLDRQLGSVEADELFRRWVVTEAHGEDLDERATAFELLDDLAERGGEWHLPDLLREDAESWEFDSIDMLTAQATAVLDLRDELSDRAAAAGVTAHDVGEERYEGATVSFAGVHRDAAVHLDAIGSVERAAVAAAAFEPNFFERVGLWGTDLDAASGEVAAAYDASDLGLVEGEAIDAAMLRSGAEDLGRSRVTYMALGGALLLLAFVMLIVWAVRRRRRRRALSAENDVTAEFDDIEGTMYGPELLQPV